MWGLHFRAPHASFYFMELSRVSILIFFLQSARLNDADENCKKNISDADFDLKNKKKKRRMCAASGSLAGLQTFSFPTVLMWRINCVSSARLY